MGPAAVLSIIVNANTAQATAALARTNRQLGQTAAAGSTTGAAMKKFGMYAALGAGVAAAASVKMAADFDKSMRNVNSIAGLNERAFQDLSQSVLDLAGPTAQAPKTLAAGLYDLVSSGFTAKESLTILRSSAKAATAGLTSTAVSTKAVAAVLNAYRRPASDAAQVSDDLFQTVNRGVITFEELAQNIGDVLPYSSSLGVDLKQVGASVATMTKEGISAPETMTRIKNVMVSMLKPSEALEAAYQKLGVSSGEQLIRQKGFQGALEAIAQTAGGSKAALAQLFPNIRALSGVLALTGKNAKAANADVRGFLHDNGITAKVFAEQSKSVALQFERLKAQASVLAIRLGNKLLPAITDVLTVLSDPNLSTSQKVGRVFARLADGVAAAAPVIAKAAVGLGAAIASGLVRGFLQADLGAKLAIILIGALKFTSAGSLLVGAGAKLGKDLLTGIKGSLTGESVARILVPLLARPGGLGLAGGAAGIFGAVVVGAKLASNALDDLYEKTHPPTPLELSQKSLEKLPGLYTDWRDAVDRSRDAQVALNSAVREGGKTSAAARTAQANLNAAYNASVKAQRLFVGNLNSSFTNALKASGQANAAYADQLDNVNVAFNEQIAAAAAAQGKTTQYQQAISQTGMSMGEVVAVARSLGIAWDRNTQAAFPLTQASRNLASAQDQAAISAVNVVRTMKNGLPPIRQSASEVGKFVRTFARVPNAKKIVLNADSDAAAGKVAKLSGALKRVAGKPAVAKIIANSKNADDATKKLESKLTQIKGKKWVARVLTDVKTSKLEQALNYLKQLDKPRRPIIVDADTNPFTSAVASARRAASASPVTIPVQWGDPGPPPRRAIGDKFFRGGPAIVNEKGAEMARFPGGDYGMLGGGKAGAQLSWLPRGTEIFTAAKTRAMIRAGVPAFAKGGTYKGFKAAQGAIAKLEDQILADTTRAAFPSSPYGEDLSPEERQALIDINTRLSTSYIKQRGTINSLLKTLPGVLKDHSGALGKIHGKGKDARKARGALRKKVAREKKQITALRDALRDLQGPSGHAGKMLAVEEVLDRLKNPDTTGPVGPGSAELADLYRALFEQQALFSAVSQAQYGVFKGLPFGGSFAKGGIVPGPLGSPRMIQAHGGEEVRPVGTPTQIVVVVEDGAVDASRIKALAAESANVEILRQTRRARPMPGRAGTLR